MEDYTCSWLLSPMAVQSAQSVVRATHLLPILAADTKALGVYICLQADVLVGL